MDEILSKLSEGGFSSSYWHDLGLKLGIHEPILRTIENDNKHCADPCLRDVIKKWLEKSSEATYNELAGALKEMGLNAVAECITNSKCIILFYIAFCILTSYRKSK